MSTRIRGDKLSPALRRQVLAQYVHRWTVENARQSYQGRCPACEQSGGAFPRTVPDYPSSTRSTRSTVRTVPATGTSTTYTRDQWHAYHRPLISDREWLRTHAFHVNARGELDGRYKWAMYVGPGGLVVQGEEANADVS